MATLAFVSRPILRHNSTNCAQTFLIAGQAGPSADQLEVVPDPRFSSTCFRRLSATQRPSLILRQFPRSPMLVFEGRVKHGLDVPVDRPHDADAREQRWPVLVLRPAIGPASRLATHRHRVRPWGSLVMYVAASRSVTSGFRPGTAIGSTNRLSQDTNLHLPLIGGATREYGTGSKHFSKVLTSRTRSSCGGRL